MKNRNYVRILLVILPILIGILSFTVIRPYTASSSFNEKTVEYLNEKKNTVLEITAASTAASAAITCIPGDVGTPIAEKLADISGYSIIILCAVFLEKYLASWMGTIAFGLIIPVAMGMFLIFHFYRNKALHQIAVRLCLYALVLTAVIPVSVSASRAIESTYQETIQETISDAEESTQQIQENTSGTDENDSLWDKFIATIEGGVSTVTAEFEGVLNNFVEAIAVMIVTSCLIPILVLLLLVWLTRILVQPYIPDHAHSHPVQFSR